MRVVRTGCSVVRGRSPSVVVRGLELLGRPDPSTTTMHGRHRSSQPRPRRSVSQVSVSSVITATFSEAVVPELGRSQRCRSSRTGGRLHAATTTATRTASFTASAPLEPLTTYSATVMSAIDTTGTGLETPYTWTFATVGRRPRHRSDEFVDEQRCTSDGSDRRHANAVELGVKFKSHRRWICHGHPLTRAKETAAHTSAGCGQQPVGCLRPWWSAPDESESGWQEANDSPLRSRWPPTRSTLRRISPRKGITR